MSTDNQLQDHTEICHIKRCGVGKKKGGWVARIFKVARIVLRIGRSQTKMDFFYIKFQDIQYVYISHQFNYIVMYSLGHCFL